MNGGDGRGRGRLVDVLDWLQALFDEAPLAIGFSRDGIVLDANPAYLALFGYERASELRGQSLLEQIAPSHRAAVLERIVERARGGRLEQRYQTRGLRKDGSEFPFEVATTRVVVADAPLTIAFLSDVSAREDALAALKASEERFRTLAGAACEAVFVHADGKILFANDAAAAMYGFDATTSMVGVPLMELTDPESRAVVADHIRRADGEPYEGIARARDGRAFDVEVRGRTMSLQAWPARPARVTVIRDVTERKRIEARVQQAQKLESLGVLAGGVAHDFNNILTVIANEVELAKREAAVGAPAVAHLDAVALAAQRAADLCRQMLAYAGKARLEREPVALSAVVGEMASMLEASIAKRATLMRDLSARLPTILGDATQIRQVVMNLVVNASEAISGRYGTIRVSTGGGTYGADAFARAAAGCDAKPGAYVWLEVEDDGVGMDARTAAHMFDPFFTTKFVGRGLGMAAVLGIVRGHGGAIDVESRPGEGTRIRVYFPARVAEPIAAAPAPAERLRGDGVVLVVDDEATVRRSTELLLRESGFEVLAAKDGPEAIEVFRSHAGRIDAVLLDMTMPRMDGIETMNALRLLAPHVPVVLTSGYGAACVGDDATGRRGPDAVLPKPYSLDRLLATLAQVRRR